ncbi:Cytochrome P450 [Arabidopsis thaliana x Arabidopsis arenosa]|uniref:Cytochrome P450 n=1 Tax=Arabidopsis thaliana x Arabidopsis arenosa TaxID=1240361 RepID=A0A8T1ZPJ6_9BRAS|nr:Cytochrome P450 [Arabidopsis thaliana x Arabidopsis arenosa]
MEMMIMILLMCSIIFITTLFFINQNSRKKSSTPPSPPRLPLIGNLHQLGRHPHRSLCSLSHRYGPLMLLHLGRVPVLVVSSADVARDVLKTHDRVFASRPWSKNTEKLLYDGRDVALAPYGEYWRQMKSVCVLSLLSNKMVRSFRDVRQQEISLMMEKIGLSSSLQVNLSEILASLTNDVICRIALGRKYGGETDFKELMKRLTRLLGAVSVGNHVPWLAWIDWLCGLDGQLEKTRNDLDEFLERVVQDHVDVNGDRTDFVDVLLAIQREKSVGFEIDRVSIKAIILDIFVGGTDTSYTLMEWVMTELLHHPECLKSLQEEVRTICKGKSSVSEEDIKDMNYLKAVIKETLRLHPPLPLMVPHESTQDVKLRDYHIPAGTVVMINAWAIGREAATWGPDAEEFTPERHLNSLVDFRGQDFELIPFGAGRRICPAISFAVALNEEVLANLVHRFDWRLPDESTEDQTSVVAESTGVAIHRMFPLYAIASSTT